MDKIFAIWPSLRDMAADLGRPYPTVASWRQRGIPPARAPEIIAAAAARGVRLDYSDLHEARLNLTPKADPHPHAERGAA